MRKTFKPILQVIKNHDHRLKKVFFLFSFALLVFNICMWTVVIHQKQKRPLVEQKYNYQISVWSKIIKEKGAAAAYEQFKKQNAPYTFYVQHANAHIFGYALYKTLGLKGVTICDDEYDGGCYHAFFATALNDYSLDKLQTLASYCHNGISEISRQEKCIHGLGHGIMFALNEEDPQKGVSLCNTIDTTEWGDCERGLFMEYFLRTTVDPSPTLSVMRPFDPKNPYDICPSFSGIERYRCFTQLPQWWYDVLKGKADEFMTIDNYCHTISDAKTQLACYKGVYFTGLIMHDYDVSEGLSFCNYLTSEKGIKLCKTDIDYNFEIQDEQQ